MDIEQAVAMAISKDFDIIEATPKIAEVPADYIENMVNLVINTIMTDMVRVANTKGKQYVERGDSEKLWHEMIKFRVGVPPDMLRAMCKTIVDLMDSSMEVVEHVLIPIEDSWEMKDGFEICKCENIYHMRMKITADDLFDFEDGKCIMKNNPTTNKK